MPTRPACRGSICPRAESTRSSAPACTTTTTSPRWSASFGPWRALRPTPPISLTSLDRRLPRCLTALSHAAVIDDPDVGPMGEGLQAVLMQPILPALHDQEIAEAIHKKFTSAQANGSRSARRGQRPIVRLLGLTQGRVDQRVHHPAHHRLGLT